MSQFATYLHRIALSDLPVLLRAPAGSRNLPRSIHALGKRRGRPFVIADCGRIARAGATERNQMTMDVPLAMNKLYGRFAAADGGTLLLDDVDRLPLNLQGVLLQLVETGEVPVAGAMVPRRVDVRVIAASRFNLRERVYAGAFRDDLFYRLYVLSLELTELG